MKKPPLLLLTMLCILVSSCAQVAPQLTAVSTTSPPSATSIPATSTLSPSSTQPPPTATSTSTSTAIPSNTPVPPTTTPVPQELLLRRVCGRDYVVKADQPLKIFYGGWAVKGMELADQWENSLVVDLSIDGETVPGQLQPPADDLPYNCKTDPQEDMYWLYSVVIIPRLPAGEHRISVVFNALSALSDGTTTYGTGTLLENTFILTAR